ncbi:MAG: hypothetical protein IT204_13360 [Fimbriimonadaceae bacterium]|nr:hypothetical protein [Fimbriimonadaceae bacterium]
MPTLTPEQWVRLVNQLVVKTSQQRVRWQLSPGLAVATVGELHTVALSYTSVQQDGAAVLAVSSLALALRDASGEEFARTTQEQFVRFPGQGARSALVTLYEVVCVRPRQQAASDFLQALDEL